MTEMYDVDILETLQKATIAAVAASGTPNIPVKYIGRTQIGVAFTKPDDGKWLEIVFIPNNPNGDHWGNEKNYAGIYRLVLHWPNNNEGAYEPMRVLASICAFFSKENRLQNVTISDNPNLTGVLEQGSELLVPASIRYTCFRP